MTRNVLARIGGVLAASLLIAVAVSQPAAAHTDLVEAAPANGAKLRSVPDVIALTFSEEMSADLSGITLSTDGQRAVSLDVRLGQTPTELIADVPDSATSDSGDASKWRVAYRVVSRDGHPVTGEVAFEVREPPSAPRPSKSPATEQPSPPPSPSASLPATDEDAPLVAESAAGDGDAVPWGAIIAGGAVLLILLSLAGLGAVRLARRNLTP